MGCERTVVETMLPLGRFPSATSSCSAIFREIADVTRISSQENAKIHFASFCYLIWRVTRAASPLKASIPSPFDHSSSEAFKSHSEKNLITKFTSDLVMEKAARIENRFQSGKSQNTQTFTSCLWLQKKKCLDFCSHFSNDTHCQRPQLANAMIWHFGNMH